MNTKGTSSVNYFPIPYSFIHSTQKSSGTVQNVRGSSISPRSYAVSRKILLHSMDQCTTSGVFAGRSTANTHSLPLHNLVLTSEAFDWGGHIRHVKKFERNKTEQCSRVSASSKNSLGLPRGRRKPRLQKRGRRRSMQRKPPEGRLVIGIVMNGDRTFKIRNHKAAMKFQFQKKYTKMCALSFVNYFRHRPNGDCTVTSDKFENRDSADGKATSCWAQAPNLGSRGEAADHDWGDGPEGGEGAEDPLR